MDTADVIFPDQGTVAQENAAEHVVRYTCHALDVETLGAMFVPPGSAARASEGDPHWPPIVIFEAVYASAVAHCFPAPALLGSAKEWGKNYYGSDGPSTSGRVAERARRADLAQDVQRKADQKKA